MISDEPFILRSILLDPAEDTPRLAYADWLDDHAADLPDPVEARSRATFIRTQIELSKLPDTQCVKPVRGGGPGGVLVRETSWQKFTPRCRCKVCTLRRREYESSKRWCVWAWCGGILKEGSVALLYPQYRRGFVDEIKITVTGLLLEAAMI